MWEHGGHDVWSESPVDLLWQYVVMVTVSLLLKGVRDMQWWGCVESSGISYMAEGLLQYAIG